MSLANLHSGHRERLRRRFLETGINSFSEHEILELLLFYALPRVNTNELAHRLLRQFGSLHEVLDAALSDLASVKGLGQSGALFLSFARDFCRYYVLSSHPGKVFSSTGDLKNYFLDYFICCDTEICLIISVDMSFSLKNSLTFPVSELLSSDFSPRRLAEIAMRMDMHRIVIGQNRPTSHPIPEASDYIITRLFSETLTPLGIEICDHIICGKGNAFSMRKNGAFSFSGEAGL